MDTTFLVHQNEVPSRNMAHEVVKALQDLDFDPSLLQEATEAVQQAIPNFEGESLLPIRQGGNGRPSRNRVRRSVDDGLDVDSVKLALQDRRMDRSRLAEKYANPGVEMDSNFMALNGRKQYLEQHTLAEDGGSVLISLNDKNQANVPPGRERNTNIGEADSIQLALNERKKGRAIRGDIGQKNSRLGEADSIQLALNDRKKDKVSRIGVQNPRIGEADSIQLALNDRKKDRVAHYREPRRSLGEADSIQLALKDSKKDKPSRLTEQRTHESEAEMVVPLTQSDSKKRFKGRALGYFGEVDSVHDAPRKRTANNQKEREVGAPPVEVEAANHEAGLDGSAPSLPVNDIKKYVLEQIPQAIREQIPADEWDKIFGGLSESASHSDSDPSGSEPSYGQIQFRSRDVAIDGIRLPEDDDDPSESYGEDVTVVSDISGLTSAFPGTITDNQSLNSEAFYNIETTMPLSGLSLSGESRQNNKAGVSRGKHATVPDAASVSSWSFYNKETIIPLSGDTVCEEPSPAIDRTTLESGPPEAGTEPTESSITCDSAVGERFKQQLAQAPAESNSGVSFGNVAIRYYENILADNPAVQCGPPVGIGWRFLIGETVKVDEWESKKDCPRISAELVMPPHVRMAILRDRGYTDREVADMIRGVRKIKAQRKQTVVNLSSAKLEEAVEKALKRVKRRVKGALRMGFRKKK